MLVYLRIIATFIFVIELSCQMVWGGLIINGPAEPPIAMTAENVFMEIASDYSVDMKGTYTISLSEIENSKDSSNSSQDYTIKFPIPPDTTDITIHMGGEEIAPKEDDDEYKPTISGMLNNTPPEFQNWEMRSCRVDLSPGENTITISYKYRLVELNEWWVLVYPLGTGGWMSNKGCLVDVSIDVDFPCPLNLGHYSATGELTQPEECVNTPFHWPFHLKKEPFEPTDDFIVLFRDAGMFDVNGDGMMGLQEAIRILQFVSGTSFVLSEDK